MAWRRVRLAFTPGFSVEFAGRDRALEFIEDLAERGTYPVYVVYGPEGCGKTALFMQAVEILEDYGYSVSMVSPLARRWGERLVTSRDLRELASGVISALTTLGAERLLDAAIEILYKAYRRGISRRVALLADDIFQAAGLDRAEQLVKSLLNMIEYPSIDYERIVVLVSSSEGVTRAKVGRHRWAHIYTLWNMDREGFRELYNQLPGSKPGFDRVWRLAGGNPWVLAELYANNWDAGRVIDLIAGRGLEGLIAGLTRGQLKILEEALEDPDALIEELKKAETLKGKKEASRLIDRLVELNMILYTIPERKEHLWIDRPPPERDPELGIGRHVAWQTPLHREALRKTLEYMKAGS